MKHRYRLACGCTVIRRLELIERQCASHLAESITSHENSARERQAQRDLIAAEAAAKEASL